MHRMYWSAHRARPVLFALVIVFMPLYMFCINIALPYVTSKGLQAILERRFDDIAIYMWLIAGVMLASIIAMVIAILSFNRTDALGAKLLQRQAFDNFLRKDYEFFANTRIGALGGFVSDLREGSIEHSRIFLFEVPKIATILITGITIIALESVILAGATLLCVVALSSFVLLFSKWRLQFRRAVSESRAALSGRLLDALSHGTTVKSFAQESHELARIEVPTETWAKHQLKTWDLFIPMNGGRNILLGLMLAALLFVSAHEYQQGSISISVLVLVQLFVVRLLTISIEVGEVVKAYDQLVSSSSEAIKMMLQPSQVTDPGTPAQPPSDMTITFKDVSFAYPEARKHIQAIESLTLTIRPGEKVGVIGFSGGGKTTLTKLLMRFMDVTSGSIHIGGADIRDIRQDDLRKLIAYVPQEPLLFHRSIKENIAYAKPDASDAEIAQASKLANVAGFVRELPNGIETEVGERGIKLSGGQRQRVAIARAILKDAPILVLDEATSALDSESELLIQQALDSLMKHRTTLVVAHRLSTIQKMDRIIVLDSGKIVEQGSHAELLALNGVYAKLWSHQSGGYIVET